MQAMQGKSGAEVAELHAGDIGAIAKLKETLTGDTLGDKSAPIYYPQARIPEPSITFAIEPKTRADEDRIGQGIHKILEEDLALRFSRDPQTKEFLLSGSGQQHIEVVVAKLRKRFQVDLTLKPPKVPYRETIRGQGRRRGQAQEADRRPRAVRRLPRALRAAAAGRGLRVRGRHFRRRHSQELDSRRSKRAFARRPSAAIWRDSRWWISARSLYDGKYHDVDSSDMAFKIAGSLAFKEGMKQARPALLEPVMHVEVYAPDQYSGDIMGDLSSRRGRISGSEARGANVVVKAQVPFAEMLSYATDLTSMTQGRASYSMEFSHYDFVPSEIAEKVIAHAKAAREGELPDEEVA